MTLSGDPAPKMPGPDHEAEHPRLRRELAGVTGARAILEQGEDALRARVLVNRVVLITGGGQGIGRELARQFAAAGAIPVVADLNVDSAARVEEEIVARGGRAKSLRVDVADAASVQAMVDEVTGELGRIDILINNAAIFATLAKRKFDQIPLDEWDFVMRVNVNGPFLCARAVVPAMHGQRWGRIINVGSTAVNRGVMNYLHYVTSKSAMVGFTNAMSRELGEDNITVNCVRLGPTATEVERTVNPTKAAGRGSGKGRALEHPAVLLQHWPVLPRPEPDAGP